MRDARERRRRALTLREAGATYAEIGRVFGVGRERARQLAERGARERDRLSDAHDSRLWPSRVTAHANRVKDAPKDEDATATRTRARNAVIAALVETHASRPVAIVRG